MNLTVQHVHIPRVCHARRHANVPTAGRYAHSVQADPDSRRGRRAWGSRKQETVEATHHAHLAAVADTVIINSSVEVER